MDNYTTRRMLLLRKRLRNLYVDAKELQYSLTPTQIAEDNVGYALEKVIMDVSKAYHSVLTVTSGKKWPSDRAKKEK